MILNFPSENIPHCWNVHYNEFYNIEPESAATDEEYFLTEDLFQASNNKYLIDLGFYEQDRAYKLALIRGDFIDGLLLELVISDSLFLIIKRIEFYLKIDLKTIDEVKGLDILDIEWTSTISYIATPNDYSVFLPLGWYLSNGEEAIHFYNELKKELPENHLLSKKDVKVVAHRLGTDDILCQDVDNPNNFAVIHLTWSMKTEIDSKYPFVEVNGTYEDFLNYEKRWY